MTIAERLHNSATHHAGFDPHCPKCLADDGIDGIIDHLAKCADTNERDAVIDSDSSARAIAAEQRRMMAILKLYRMVATQRESSQTAQPRR